MPRDYLVFRYMGGMGAKVSLYGQGRGNNVEEAVRDAVKEQGEEDKFPKVMEVDYSDVNGFMAVPITNVHHLKAEKMYRTK